MQSDDLSNQQNCPYQSLPESISTAQTLYSPPSQTDSQMHHGSYQQSAGQASHENNKQPTTQSLQGAYQQPTADQLHHGTFQLHHGPFQCQTVSTCCYVFMICPFKFYFFYFFWRKPNVLSSFLNGFLVSATTVILLYVTRTRSPLKAQRVLGVAVPPQ